MNIKKIHPQGAPTIKQVLPTIKNKFVGATSGRPRAFNERPYITKGQRFFVYVLFLTTLNKKAKTPPNAAFLLFVLPQQFRTPRLHQALLLQIHQNFIVDAFTHFAYLVIVISLKP